MTGHMCRKAGLPIVAVVLITAFTANAAHGQFRPPRMPFGPPPNMRPPGFPRTGPAIIKVWTCTGCGKELGRGLSAPPDKCPHCGARIINGVGNGIPQPGTSGMDHHPQPNPGPNPNPPGFVPNPPVMDPNPPGMIPPAFNPNPPAIPPNFVNPPPTDNAPDASNSSGSSGGLSRGKIIALVIGVIVVGVAVLLGGTGLLIYTLKSGEKEPRRRRRRREDDY